MEIVTLTIKLAVNKGRDKFAFYVCVLPCNTLFFVVVVARMALTLATWPFEVLEEYPLEVGEPCPDQRVYISVVTFQTGDIPTPLDQLSLTSFPGCVRSWGMSLNCQYYEKMAASLNV